MNPTHIITLTQFLAPLPRVLARLPKLLKGLGLVNITDPRRPVGLGLTVQDAVRRNPDGTALMYRDTHLTYRQFNEWANRIAHYLAARDVKKGDVVAVMLENRPELLAVLTGCAKIGAVAALLNAQHVGRTLSYSFNLAKPRLAIIGTELIQPFDEIRRDLEIDADAVYCLADVDTLADAGDAPAGYRNLAAEIRTAATHDPDAAGHIHINDPLFYIYTSGTSGLPKAVVFTHGRWMKAYGAFGFSALGLTPQDRLYASLPLYHATGLCVCWSSALAGAAGFVIARKFSASHFWDDIRHYRATSFGYVGELCRYLLDQPPRSNDRDHAVRAIVGNGLRPHVWMPFKERFGVAEIREFYASSEGNVGFVNLLNLDLTVGVSTVPYAIVRYDKENERPFRNARGHLEKVKKGEVGLLVGEITAKSPFRGYTDPDKTEQTILRDAFKKGDAYFNTGDLMRDMGFRHAQFVDRLGDTFRWKGENVSTTEVESVLDGFPGIAESVVYGVEIPGREGRCGMALLRLATATAPFDFRGLARHLRHALPPYAVPLFLRLSDAVDTTGTFKHQKIKLKDEGFDPNKTSTPVYVLLPNATGYVYMTRDVEADIRSSKHRL